MMAKKALLLKIITSNHFWKFVCCSKTDSYTLKKPTKKQKIF